MVGVIFVFVVAAVLLASWAKESSSSIILAVLVVTGICVCMCIESVVNLGLFDSVSVAVAVAIVAVSFTRRSSSFGGKSFLFVAVHDATRAPGDSANCCRQWPSHPG
jgi:hypothetical protein